MHLIFRNFPTAMRSLFILLFICTATLLRAQRDDVIVNVELLSTRSTQDISCDAPHSVPQSGTQNGTPVALIAVKMIPGVTYNLNFTMTYISQVEYATISVFAPDGYEVYVNGLRTSEVVLASAASPTTQSFAPTIKIVYADKELGLRAGMATSLSTDRTFWQLSLGALSNGKAAGYLSFNNVHDDFALAVDFSAANVMCSATASDVKILYKKDANQNAYICQVAAPQVIVEIVYTAGATAMDVKCYHPSLATPDSNGIYNFNVDPFAWYIVTVGATDADGISIQGDFRDAPSTVGTAVSQVFITTLKRTVASGTTKLIATGWTRQGKSTLAKQVRAIDATKETITVEDAATGSVALKTVRSYYVSTDTFLSTRIGSETMGTSNPITLNYTYVPLTWNGLGFYYNSPPYGFVQAVTDSGGGKSSYDYQPLYAYMLSRVKNLTDDASCGESITRTVDSLGSYSRVSTRTDNDDEFVNEAVTYDDSFANSVYTASAYPLAGHSWLGTYVATIKDTPGDGSTLTTTVRSFAENAGTKGPSTDDFYASLPYAVTYPTGIKKSFFYIRGSWDDGSLTFTPSGNQGADAGSVVRNGVSVPTYASQSGVLTGVATGGTPAPNDLGFPLDSVGLIEGKSTREMTWRDNYARVVRTEVDVWAAGIWNTVSRTTYSYNLANQLIGRTSIDGTTYSAHYVGEQLQSEVDEYGISTGYTYDDGDRVYTKTVAGLTTTYGYDAAGHVTSETVQQAAAAKPGEILETLVTTRQYDDAGRLYTEATPGVAATIHTYDPTTNTHTVTLPSTDTRIEQYYPGGRLKSLTGTAVVPTYFDYGNGWQTISYGSKSSNRWKKTTFDSLGRIVSIQQPDPSVIGQVATAGTGSTVSTKKLYDASTGMLASISQTGKATSYYQYDELGQLNRAGLHVDGSTNLSLKSNDRITDILHNIQSDTNGNWWDITKTTIYPNSGDATGVPVSTVSIQLSGLSGGVVGKVQSVDIDGNTTSEVTTLAAASATMTTTTTAPGMKNSATESWTNGRSNGTTDFDGLSVSYGYDGLMRLKTITDKRNNTTTATYIPGTTFIWQVTDGASNTTSYGYDSLGRQNAVTENLASTANTAYTDYNGLGEPLHRWGNGTYPLAYQYSVYGEQTGLSTYRSKDPTAWSDTKWPSSAPVSPDQTTWNYDDATGALVRKLDAPNNGVRNTVSYTYNQLGQVLTSTTARNIVKTNGYDPNTAELTSVAYSNYVDPRGTTITTPGVSYTYTRLGQLLNVTDATFQNVTDGSPQNRVFNYYSDAPWRLNTISLPSFFKSRTLKALYESTTSASAGTVNGRAVGFESATVGGTELHQQAAISNLGRLHTIDSRTGTTDAIDYTFGYAPDGLPNGYTTGNIAAGTTGNFAVGYHYEAKRTVLDRINASWSSTVLHEFDYTANEIGQIVFAQQTGKVFHDTYGGSVYRSNIYNSRGETQSSAMYNGTPPALGTSPTAADELPARRYEFRYDDIGNRSTVGERGVSPSDDQYTVNTLNQYTEKQNNTVRVFGTVASGAKVSAYSSDAQLVNFNVTATGSSFGGDLVPNTAVGPATGYLQIYGYNGTDVYSTMRPWQFSGFSQTLSYDADGNLTTDGIFDYYYDAENQLVQMATTAGAVSAGFPFRLIGFTYDYLGRRVAKQVYDGTGTKSTRFIYDGRKLVEEIDGATLAQLKTYTWHGDTLLQVQDLVAGKTLLAGEDGNNNVVTLTNASSGTVEAIYEYSPAGELVHSEGIYANSNPFRFASEYQDDETGLVYFGLRYYSPALGRFINRDPIEEGGGANLYAYCNNDAVNGRDFMGLTQPTDGSLTYTPPDYGNVNFGTSDTDNSGLTITFGSDSFDGFYGPIFTVVPGNGGKGKTTTGTHTKPAPAPIPVMYSRGYGPASDAHNIAYGRNRSTTPVLDITIGILQALAAPVKMSYRAVFDNDRLTTEIAEQWSRDSAAAEELGAYGWVGGVNRYSPAVMLINAFSEEDFITGQQLTLEENATNAAGFVMSVAPTVKGIAKGTGTLTRGAAAGTAAGLADDVATLKSIRRYAERLVRGKATSSNPATILEVRDIQAAIANGNFRGAGTGFHELNFRFAADAQGRGFLTNLNIDQTIATRGGFLRFRRPDYLFRRGGIYDIKPFRPSAGAYDATRQFLDIQGATGVMPVPLYYRLW